MPIYDHTKDELVSQYIDGSGETNGDNDNDNRKFRIVLYIMSVLSAIVWTGLIFVDLTRPDLQAETLIGGYLWFVILALVLFSAKKG